MKEIIIKLADKIADYIAKDADNTGVTSEDLIKYILGRYVRADMRENSEAQHHMTAIPIDLSGLFGSFESAIKKMGTSRLKEMAEKGALSCKNCTMKIKPEDIDAGKCGSCGVPLKEALGGQIE